MVSVMRSLWKTNPAMLSIDQKGHLAYSVIFQPEVRVSLGSCEPRRH